MGINNISTYPKIPIYSLSDFIHPNFPKSCSIAVVASTLLIQFGDGFTRSTLLHESLPHQEEKILDKNPSTTFTNNSLSQKDRDLPGHMISGIQDRRVENSSQRNAAIGSLSPPM